MAHSAETQCVCKLLSPEVKSACLRSSVRLHWVYKCVCFLTVIS